LARPSLVFYFPGLDLVAMDFLEALLGGGFFCLTGWVYERFTGRVGMGEGDVKRMVMIGAILGADSLPYLVCVSALLSTLAGLELVLSGGGRGGEWRTTRIPCGDFPAAGALFYLLAQGQIPRFFGWT
jgi:leader peptidase (prepilin peptidase)/N-methyltransferase